MRISIVTAVLAITATAALAGCKKQSRAAPSPAPVAEVAPRPSAAEAPPSPETMRTLAGRLDYEAANRPTGATRVEDVWAALSQIGVAVTDTKQYLGLTAAASYCAGGRTADGVTVAVCEYPSADAAAAGRDQVTKRFPIGPSRQITVRGATTLTTTTPDGQDLGATRARIEQAFLAM